MCINKLLIIKAKPYVLLALASSPKEREREKQINKARSTNQYPQNGMHREIKMSR